MDVRFLDGVRVDGLAFDPLRPVRTAFWTHRTARRARAQKAVAAEVLARTWRGVAGLPFEQGVIAFGMRLELLRSGYGPGGAAVLLTRSGQRVFVVGPTTTELEPRKADRLVLYAAPLVEPDEAWLDRVRGSRGQTTIDVPDGAAASVVSRALHAQGVPHLRPGWLGASDRGARYRLRVVSTAPTDPKAAKAGAPKDKAPPALAKAPTITLDARPQADDAWLVELAQAIEPELVVVHGPRAETLAQAITEAELAARVLHSPRQLAFAGLYPEGHTPTDD